MIGYTCVGTNDLEKAVVFYGELLDMLGAKPFFKSDRGVGWGVSPDKPMFSVMVPYDGQRATTGNGTMVALAASDHEQVQALHAKALSLGASDEVLRGQGEAISMAHIFETQTATNWLFFACRASL